MCVAKVAITLGRGWLNVRKSNVVAASALTVVLASTTSVADAKNPVEPMYANDTVVFMMAPQKAMDNGSKNTAQDFYLIAYPTVPSGVHPLCNFTCPGPPGIPPVRDVVLEGAPGFGNSGTAGAFNPAWHVIALAYNPAWLNNPNFVPAMSQAELDAGEAAGHFLPINPDPNASNPFEIDTGINFLCVIASSHA